MHRLAAAMLLSGYLSPLLAIEPYQASYSVHFGPFHLGNGTYTLQQQGPDSYRFSFHSELSLLLLSDTRSISSQFIIDQGTILAGEFRQQRKGVGRDFTETIHWQAEAQRTSSQLNQETVQFDYLPRVFDALNAQLQMRLDLIAGHSQFNYRLLMKNKVDDYRWLARGKELLTIGDKTYPSVKFEMQRDTSKRQTFIWFGTGMNYLPLRVLYTIKGTGSIDMRLLDYSETPDYTETGAPGSGKP